MAKRTVITRGISFQPELWKKLQVATANGYNRSRLVEMGLMILERERPDIFLPFDYSKVINLTNKDPEAPVSQVV